MSTKRCRANVCFLGAPIPVICLIWGTLIIVGLLLSVDHDSRPSETGIAPTRWPDSVTFVGNGNKPVLLMFVHPFCPCSRASLSELANVLGSCHGTVEARVIFFASPALSRPPQQSDSWQQAKSIPDVIVECDPEGTLSRTFGAYASGSVVVFDRTGRLMFAGGITAGRGHVGDNPGASAVAALLHRRETTCQFNSVFGCPITTMPSDSEGAVQ